jgi:hypothetical protein
MNIIKYLNIIGYKYEAPFMEEYLITKKQSYFWITASKLATFYKIKSISGIILFPILSIKNIKEKIINNKLIIMYYTQKCKRIYNEKYLSLILTFLPNELIKKIVQYSYITYF